MSKTRARLLCLYQEHGGLTYEIEVKGPNSNIKGWVKDGDAKKLMDQIDGFINEVNGVEQRTNWQAYLQEEAVDQETRAILRELGL